MGRAEVGVRDDEREISWRAAPDEYTRMAGVECAYDMGKDFSARSSHGCHQLSAWKSMLSVATETAR
jgi:hypothetical protein